MKVTIADKFPPNGALRVFVTRELPGPALPKLRARVSVELWPDDAPPPRPALLAESAQSDGIISLLTDRIDAEVISSSPQLRVIANVATGYDNIDLAAASARAIAVTNTPGVLDETTADFAFALLMAVARRLAEADRFVREGRWNTWSPTLLLGHDVHGATLGVVGLGGVGAAMARRGRGFGMRVLYHSRTRKPGLEAELDLHPRGLSDLLHEADFVSLHVPFDDQTRGLIGRSELAAMKPSAILVNTARGGVVDQAALTSALKNGTIAGAGLDVSDPEPLDSTDPLTALDNVVLAPHIASASEATRSRMAMMAVDNCLAALEGKMPLNCLNPEAFARQVPG